MRTVGVGRHATGHFPRSDKKMLSPKTCDFLKSTKPELPQSEKDGVSASKPYTGFKDELSVWSHMLGPVNKHLDLLTLASTGSNALPSRTRALFPLTFAGFFCIFYRKIVSKIDEDKDGFVTVEELKDWIKFAQKRWIYEDVERQWKGHDLNEDGLISWEEYKNATYGYILGRSLLLG